MPGVISGTGYGETPAGRVDALRKHKEEGREGGREERRKEEGKANGQEVQRQRRISAMTWEERLMKRREWIQIRPWM
jgi:hypothetical protein